MIHSVALAIRLFGGFEARLNGSPVTRLRLRDGERVLAYMLCQHGRPVERTRLAQMFWINEEREDSLRHSLTNLRQALDGERGRLRSGHGLVWFEAAGSDVDVVRFDAAIQRGDRASLHEATSLYTGPLLPTWEDSWVKQERDLRHRRYLEALQKLAANLMGDGDYSSAIEYLRRLLTLAPSDQRTWTSLMKALALSDERIAAVDLYQRYQSYLTARHADMSPPAGMTRLYHDLRANAPSNLSYLQAIPEVEPIPEPIGGAVPLDSRFYIERPADAELRMVITRRDSVVLIRGPRQVGKSSLLARGLHEARKSGATVLFTDLETVPEVALLSMESLCRHLTCAITDQLRLTVDPYTAWRPMFAPAINLERFLHEHVFAMISSPFVWGLDEVDRLFTCSFNSEFFAVLRSWHEKRSFDPGTAWARLTLALACATEAHLFIKDLNQSPFNVGTRLTLADFTQEQVAELNRRHGSPLTEEEQSVLYNLTTGHPFLTRKALYELVTNKASLTELLARAEDPDGPFGEHLRRMARFLAEDRELKEAVLAVIHGKPCSEASFFRLRSAGVLAGRECAQARPRCGLYARYLERHLP